MNDTVTQQQETCVLKSAVERGVVKAHINFVKQNNIPVAVACFALSLSTQAEEKLEEIIVLLEQDNNYAPIYQCEIGLFFTFMRNMQLHHSVHLLKKFSHTIEKLHDISISYGALTMIDKDDTYATLISRISKYIGHACIVGDGKICYGTSQYDFSTKKDEEDILKNFFISSSHAKLYNFYNGIPLSEEVQVLSYNNGILRIKVSLGKATFLKHEPFTFLKHELLPDTLKADIVNTFPRQGEAILSNLRFIEKSPVDREKIRVKPNVPIDVSIENDNGLNIKGTIESISVDTIAIKPEEYNLPDSYFEAKDARFTLVFKLQGTEGKTTNMRVFANFLTKNDERIVFSIHMSRFFKQKIENYIELKQATLMTIVQKMVLDFYQK